MQENHQHLWSFIIFTTPLFPTIHPVPAHSILHFNSHLHNNNIEHDIVTVHKIRMQAIDANLFNKLKCDITHDNYRRYCI